MTEYKEVSEEEIKNEIVRLSQKHHDGDRPSIKTLKEDSTYTRNDVKKHFEKWNDALECIGFEAEIKQYNHEEIEKEIYRVRNKMGRPPRIKDFKEESNISPFSISNKYGGWVKALIVHGIEPKTSQLKNIDEEDIIDDFQKKVKEEDGVITSDKYRDIGKYDVHTIQNKFGSWADFVEECGYEPVGRPGGEEHYNWNGGWDSYYGPSWNKQRTKARERDQYRCQVCYKSENSLDRKPDVHHIKPTHQFNIKEEHKEMNELNNLITLCSTCHHTGIEGKWQESTPEEFKYKAKKYYGVI